MRCSVRTALWRGASLAALIFLDSSLHPCTLPQLTVGTAFLASSSGPVVTLSPTSINFGNQAVGTTSTGQTITVTNTGDSTLNITSIKLSGGNRSDFSQTNTCGSTLNVGANCTISVTFTPSHTGSRTSSVSISDNASGSPQTVSLSGTGTAPTASLSAGSLSFAGQTVGSTSAAQSVTLTNSGSASLSITSIATTGDFSQSNTCGTSLAAGANCSISVSFTPTAIWTRTGTVTLTDNSSNGTQQVILLVGMGNGTAAASLSPNSLSFGNQNVGTTSPGQTFTVTNSGTAVLTIKSILASGDFAQSNNCGASLNTGASCTVTVTFTPSASGSRTGYITLNDTAPALLQTVTLSGNGTTVSSTVAVSPRAASVTFTQTQQFSATISGVVSTNVTWSVDGIVGGTTTVGTISTAGLYTPPPAAGSHAIEATSIADPTQSATVPLIVTNYAGTFTYKNDNLRTGQNASETVLTTGNVNKNQFGKLFTYPVDGYTYAQPLYVPSVNIAGQGFHNVVYVATEHDSVYAFDADGLATTPLWQASFTDPSNGIGTVPRADVEVGYDITPEVGITATPVIDLARNTLFVLARTKEVENGVSSYVQRLHALDITSGTEQPGSPVVIQATVSGTGVGGNGNGQISFDPLHENNRAALLLLNGTVYIGWASLEDIGPYHGWVIGYDEASLQQVSVLNITPNGSDGAIWQGGCGPAADAAGNIFFATGNGTFDANTGGVDYGNSVVKVTNSGGTLSVADYFTPYNQASLNSGDWDVGAGGTLLLPDQPGSFPHLALAAGKGSTIYELNRDNLGKYNVTSNQIVATIPAAIGPVSLNAGNRGGPAYWQGQVYYVGSRDYMKQFALYNGLIPSLPLAIGSKLFAYPGAAPAISANGNSNGIVWALQVDAYASSGSANLRAYDAANVSRELYNSKQNFGRDNAGPAVKFTVPTVANGKVYVPTQTELDVYGLLP